MNKIIAKEDQLIARQILKKSDLIGYPPCNKSIIKNDGLINVM